MSKTILNEGILTIGGQSWGFTEVATRENATSIDTGDGGANHSNLSGRVAVEFTATVISDSANPVPLNMAAQTISLIFGLREYSGSGHILNVREQGQIDKVIFYEVLGFFKGSTTVTGVDITITPQPIRASARAYIDPDEGVALPPLEIPGGARSVIARTINPNILFGNTVVLPGNVIAIARVVDPTVIEDLSVTPSTIPGAIADRFPPSIIDTAVVESTIGTGGDYASVQAWIADKAGDFVTSKVIQRGILISDISVTSPINFSTGGATTSENYYWHLTSDTPTDGLPGTGHRLINNLSSNDYFVRSSGASVKIDGIELDLNGNDSYNAIDFIGCDRADVQRCLIHSGYFNAGTGYGIALRNGHLMICANNIIRDCEYTGVVSYAFFSWNYDFLYLMNNICYNNFSNTSGSIMLGLAGYVQAGAVAYIKNNISLDTAGLSSDSDYQFNLSGGTYYIDNNISGDATAPGNNPITGESATDLFNNPAAGDLTPKNYCASIEAGVPAADQIEALTIDNIIRPQGNKWDIGPYEHIYYLSDWSSGLDGWAAAAGVTLSYGNLIGGESNCLRLDLTTTGIKLAHKIIGAEFSNIDNSVKISFKYYAPTGSSFTNIQALYTYNGLYNSYYAALLPLVKDSDWHKIEFIMPEPSLTARAYPDYGFGFRLYGGVSGDDLYIKDFKTEEWAA